MAANQVQSLKRAIALLKAIDDARRPLTLHEFAERTELAKSTVHRLLATLREEDLVEQLPDGRYSLGLHLFEMGCSAGYMRDIVFIARPYMQAVWKQTNESVSLALLSHGEAIVLSLIESTNAFRVVARTGSRLPAHCTVQGKIMLAHTTRAEVKRIMCASMILPCTVQCKIMLAHMTRAEVKRILREHGMQAYTTNTYRSYEELEPELRRIREQGYAVDNSEYHAGLCSVAAPIYEENGTCAYSFSIVSMLHHTDSPEFLRARNLALIAARDISFSLGYRGDAFANVIEVSTTMGVLAPVGPEGKPPGGR